MRQIETSSILKTGENCIEAELDGYVIILVPSSGTYFRLNSVARCAWYAIKAAVTFGEVCSQVRDRFDVDEQTCENELRRLINELVDLRLVVISANSEVSTQIRESERGILGV